MIRLSHVALVASAALVSASASGAIAGFLSGLAHVPQLTRFLLIPLILGMTHLAGRWIARRQSPPAAAEFLLGGIVYVLLSISDALSHGQVRIGLAALGSGGFVLLLAYSALAGMRSKRLAAAERTG